MTPREIIAKYLWDDRETSFAPRLRNSWRQGSGPACDIALQYADEIIAAVSNGGWRLIRKEPMTQDEIDAHNSGSSKNKESISKDGAP